MTKKKRNIALLFEWIIFNNLKSKNAHSPLKWDPLFPSPPKVQNSPQEGPIGPPNRVLYFQLTRPVFLIAFISRGDNCFICPELLATLSERGIPSSA